MIRKIIVYGSFLIELVFLLYTLYCFLYAENMISTLFTISIVMLTLNIPALIISILLFGAPRNNYCEYFIRYISYDDILKENHKLTVEYKDGVWQYYYKNKYYKFDLKWWPNVRKRISDMIFIQYHNNYCNIKKVKNKNYYKNYFKKYKIKIEFIKNNKYIIQKFKPSFMLKLKMIISCSQFKHQKYHLDDVWKRDLWDTFLVIKTNKKC